MRCGVWKTGYWILTSTWIGFAALVTLANAQVGPLPLVGLAGKSTLAAQESPDQTGPSLISAITDPDFPPFYIVVRFSENVSFATAYLTSLSEPASRFWRLKQKQY